MVRPSICSRDAFSSWCEDVEARQRALELVAQALAYFALDLTRAREQPEPEPQRGMRTLVTLGDRLICSTVT